MRRVFEVDDFLFSIYNFGDNEKCYKVIRTEEIEGKTVYHLILVSGTADEVGNIIAISDTSLWRKDNDFGRILFQKIIDMLLQLGYTAKR